MKHAFQLKSDAQNGIEARARSYILFCHVIWFVSLAPPRSAPSFRSFLILDFVRIFIMASKIINRCSDLIQLNKMQDDRWSLWNVGKRLGPYEDSIEKLEGVDPLARLRSLEKWKSFIDYILLDEVSCLL